MTQHHETGLKKRQRGWYTDPSPGLKDLKGKFEDAERTSGVTSIKKAAVLDVLRKFALFQDSEQPVETFAQIIQQTNFGYGDPQKGPSPTGRKNLFGPSVPLYSGYGDQVIGRQDSIGSV